VSAAKTFIAVLTLAAALPALAFAHASKGPMTCHASFSHVPGHKAGTLAYTVAALKGKHSAAALTCLRGKNVIQAGFTKFGKKTTNYRNVGKLHVVVSKSRYTLALPKPVASGSYAWTGAGTRVQYSLPTGK
jgi:hypothetical protein